MKTFTEWLEIREGTQGLKARMRRAVGLAKRADRLGDYWGGEPGRAQDLAGEVERATAASVSADRSRTRREIERRDKIVAGGSEGRIMARDTSPQQLKQHRDLSRRATKGMALSFGKSGEGSHKQYAGPDEIRDDLFGK